MNNLNNLIQLLQPYNDAYSKELKGILTANIGKPLESLRSALNKCKETPTKLHPIEVNLMLSEIISPDIPYSVKMNDNGMNINELYSYPKDTNLYLGQKIDKIEQIGNPKKGYYIELDNNDFVCRDVEVLNENELNLKPRNPEYAAQTINKNQISTMYEIDKISF